MERLILLGVKQKLTRDIKNRGSEGTWGIECDGTLLWVLWGLSWKDSGTRQNKDS